MKKFAYLTLTLVLTAALFAGCGCTNRNTKTTITTPTILPTTEMTSEPTHATTEMTTEPTYATNHTEGTIDNGNGPLENETTTATDGVTGGTAEGRARSVVPNR